VKQRADSSSIAAVRINPPPDRHARVERGHVQSALGTQHELLAAIRIIEAHQMETLLAAVGHALGLDTAALEAPASLRSVPLCLADLLSVSTARKG